MSIFQKGRFKLHSGKISTFKIECDDLTYADVVAITNLIRKRYKFRSVYGVPTGGEKFEKALERYRTYDHKDPVLIVDDVWTTGDSMRTFIKDDLEIANFDDILGVVVFARGTVPKWVKPIFQMW